MFIAILIYRLVSVGALLSHKNLISGMEAPKSALVFGASGITGWAIANTALTYPSKDTFSRVIALRKRPLSRKDSKFPEDSCLVLQSGVDLSGDEASIVESLKLIEGISKVTHVYFTGEA